MSEPKKLDWVQVSEFSPAYLQSADDGKVLSTRVKNKKLCLAKFQGAWYAVDARCPHSGGPLPGGWIGEEGQVVCPWHRFEFDLKTGQCRNAGFYINAYEVKEESGYLWVGFPRRKFLGLF